MEVDQLSKSESVDKSTGINCLKFMAYFYGSNNSLKP